MKRFMFLAFLTLTIFVFGCDQSEENSSQNNDPVEDLIAMSTCEEKSPALEEVIKEAELDCIGKVKTYFIPYENLQGLDPDSLDNVSIDNKEMVLHADGGISIPLKVKNVDGFIRYKSLDTIYIGVEDLSEPVYYFINSEVASKDPSPVMKDALEEELRMLMHAIEYPYALLTVVKTDEVEDLQNDNNKNQTEQEERCESTEQSDDQGPQCVFPQEDEEQASPSETSEENVIGIRVIRWDTVLRVDPYSYDGALYDNYCNEVYNEELVVQVGVELVPYFNDYSTCYFVCEDDLPNTYFYWADTGHPSYRYVEMRRAEPDYRITDRECYCVSYPHMLVVVEGDSPNAQF